MRISKFLLAGLLSLSIANGSELPDFREFIKMGETYTLIPVDETRSINVSGGMGGYYAVVRVGAPKKGYCLANNLRIFTTIQRGGLEVEKEYPYDISTWGLTIGQDADFRYYGYCKDKDGNVVVEYRGDLIVHPPSKVREVVFDWYEERKMKNVNSFEDMLREFKGKPVVKGGDLYEVKGINIYHALGLCRKQGGELYMVYKGQAIPFVEYMWEMLNAGKFKTYTKTSPWFNPAEFGKVMELNNIEHVNRFTGLYFCQGGSEEWTFSYNPKVYQGSLILIAQVRKGIDQKAVAKFQRESREMPRQEVSDTDRLLALQTARLKAPSIVQVGSVVYETSYNGESQGCSLVSVSQKIGGKVQAINNYRVCGENVEYIGESGVPALPKGIESVKRDIARLCQRFGQAQLNYEGTVIQCRALRDKDLCLVELTYLQGNKLVGKEEVNGCN